MLPSIMQTVTLVSVFVLVAMLLLTAPPVADAECCFPAASGYRCFDCTNPTPYCGYGRCNLFGCDCRNGCRQGACNGKRSVDAQVQNVTSIISSGDLNGDGFLSIDEAEIMLLQGPAAEHHRNVRSLDKNMDGLLSADEIDN